MSWSISENGEVDVNIEINRSNSIMNEESTAAEASSGNQKKTQYTIPIDRQVMGQTILFSEAKADSSLYQMALALQLGPNEIYPDHVHVSTEWCFLMQGSLRDNFGTKTAPCFFLNEQGSIHRDIQAGDQGCELFVIKGSKPNLVL